MNSKIWKENRRWGVREATTMMVAFGYAGLALTDGTLVSILFGAVRMPISGNPRDDVHAFAVTH